MSMKHSLNRNRGLWSQLWHRRLYLLSLCVLMSVAGPALAKGFKPEAGYYPGGVAIIKVPQHSQSAPLVTFQGKRLYTQRTPEGDWEAWVGLPLSLKPGEYQVDWAVKTGNLPLHFTVEPKQYREQRLNVDRKHVDLSAENLARYQREKPEILGALDGWRPTQTPLGAEAFVPVAGERSDSFGFRRIFNGEARNPHSGMDIAAPEGTPVYSLLPGRVAAIGDYFFNGKTVILDHGQGLTSLYCHLSSIEALRVGQTLPGGTQLGEVGATGRVTGPHLHLTVSLNGARVNPALFLPRP